MYMYCSIDYTLNAWCVRQSRYLDTCGNLPGTLALFAHAQLNPFYHPFYPDVTHEKRYQALSHFSILHATDEKLGGAWEQG